MIYLGYETELSNIFKIVTHDYDLVQVGIEYVKVYLEFIKVF
ncbi:hypothetical protein M6B38_234315 [Iris pallida]|uniref:Uncharacterized protein n=1 Tax=Iris pallida TaxID=29817 RepID=A0AAX6DPW8_IRIPA|nr:hypothetical protein M6B38_234315 [Iris pallida]